MMMMNNPSFDGSKRMASVVAAFLLMGVICIHSSTKAIRKMRSSSWSLSSSSSSSSSSSEVARRLNSKAEEMAQHVPDAGNVASEIAAEVIEITNAVLGGQSRTSYIEETRRLPYELPPAAADWCLPATVPPLDYYQCRNRDLIARAKIRQGSGMGSAMGNILDVAMWAARNDICFFLDETQTFLRDQAFDDSEFINRYFEPIGMPMGSKTVRDALASHESTGQPHIENYVLHPDVETISWSRERLSIPKLDLWNLDRHAIKKKILRRMWRLLPAEQETACTRLASHDLKDEYIALSFRRGDKAIEAKTMDNGVELTPVSDYIEEAKYAIREHFDGETPKFFVATDDCTVMAELREARPDWRFESECPPEESGDEHGYFLQDMSTWNQEQLDDHLRKFFVELIGMATAKYFIGVPYTNVSHWVFYMRGQPDDTFKLIRGELSKLK